MKNVNEGETMVFSGQDISIVLVEVVTTGLLMRLPKTLISQAWVYCFEVGRIPTMAPTVFSAQVNIYNETTICEFEELITSMGSANSGGMIQFI